MSKKMPIFVVLERILQISSDALSRGLKEITIKTQ